MSRSPRVTGDELVTALSKADFTVIRTKLLTLPKRYGEKSSLEKKHARLREESARFQLQHRAKQVYSLWLTAEVDTETDLPSGVRVYLLNQLIM
jgi:hypothetical protein